ncbi:MAG: hypothetical protein Q7R67_01290 [bacterium]|nr:hypothetical protein [bacterium]
MNLLKIENSKLKIVANIKPVNISIAGYCMEIFEWHRAQRPFNAIKLTIGTSSHHLKVLLHEAHDDRPPRDNPEFHRKPTTLRKLPTTAPKRKRKKVSTS